MFLTLTSIFAFCIALANAAFSTRNDNFEVVEDGSIDEYPYFVSRDSFGSYIMWANYDFYANKGNINVAHKELFEWALMYYDQVNNDADSTAMTSGCKKGKPQYSRELLGQCICSKDQTPGWTDHKIPFHKLTRLIKHSNQLRLQNKPYAVCTMHRNQRACVSWAMNSYGVLEEKEFDKILADCYGLCTSKHTSCHHQVKQLHENESVCFSDNPKGCKSWATC